MSMMTEWETCSFITKSVGKYQFLLIPVTKPYDLLLYTLYSVPL